jgi:hypothetical protein
MDYTVRAALLIDVYIPQRPRVAAKALTLGVAAAQSEARRIIHAGRPYSALDTATVESQALLAPVQLYLRYSTKLG